MGQMTQPTVSKHWRNSPKNRLQSHQVHLRMLQYYTCMQYTQNNTYTKMNLCTVKWTRVVCIELKTFDIVFACSFISNPVNLVFQLLRLHFPVLLTFGLYFPVLHFAARKFAPSFQCYIVYVWSLSVLHFQSCFFIQPKYFTGDCQSKHIKTSDTNMYVHCQSATYLTVGVQSQ